MVTYQIWNTINVYLCVFSTVRQHINVAHVATESVSKLL